MQIAVVLGGRFWILKIGYDEIIHGFPWHSVVERVYCLCGTGRLEFLRIHGPHRSWTATWTDLERQCVALRVYPYNLFGGAALLADSTVKIATTLGQRIRRATVKARGSAADRRLR